MPDTTKIEQLVNALAPLALAARAQHTSIMIRARVQEGDTKQESLAAAARWLALHDAAAAAIANSKEG